MRPKFQVPRATCSDKNANSVLSDDRKLFLWSRQHADIRNGYNHADRIHAEEIIVRSSSEQLCPQHSELRRGNCGSTYYRSHWQRLAVYDSWVVDTILV